MGELTEEHVIWGAASILLRQHGERAPLMVAERIDALAVESDDLGCAIWKAIAGCMDQLLHSTSEH